MKDSDHRSAGRDASARSNGQAGKGMVGFIVSVALVTYAANGLWRGFQIEHRHNQMKARTEEVLGDAARLRWDVDMARAKLVKAAGEIGVPIVDNAVVVEIVGNEWRVKVRWTDVFRIPGYSRSRDFVVERKWELY